eukprot:1784952-Pyramimonas_sp.AAC.1
MGGSRRRGGELCPSAPSPSPSPAQLARCEAPLRITPARMLGDFLVSLSSSRSPSLASSSTPGGG